MYDRRKVIDTALAEVGYLEKASNSQLDDKTANAGKGNFTKYARDLDNIKGFYNGGKNGFDWCDVFVDWAFVTAYGADAAKELLCQPDKSLGAGCKYSRNYYKNRGQLYLKNPEPGDQIFFFAADMETIQHTGLVYDVDDEYVYTIEGNTSDSAQIVPNGGCVAKKRYKLTLNRIAGYGRPAYGDEELLHPADPAIPVLARLLKRYCIGDDVKALQARLEAIGYDPSGVDGIFGKDTRAAVIAFQQDNGLEADGVVGEQTWEALWSKDDKHLIVRNGGQPVEIYGDDKHVTCTLDDGTPVEVLEEKDGMKRVQVEGWVNGGYLR